MESLQKLEGAIKSHLKETYLPPHRAKTPGWTYHDLKFFAKGADILSTAFTEGRSELPKNYFNKKEFRSAYLLYFLIPNFVKVWKCLEQIPFLYREGEGGPLKILDLGSGPGTAALACSAFFKDRPITVMGFEQNEGIKRDAFALWKKLAPQKHRLVFTRHSIPPEKFDLAIAANFLSELPFDQQIDFSTSTLLHSNTFIIMEPALQKTTRQLMLLRDKLLEAKAGFVLAPCLHQQNCPMLRTNKRDWCHFYIQWKCPYLIRQIDELVHNKHDYLKMAYVILQPQRVPIHESRITNQWRVVSSSLISKGKREFILCGDCGFLKKITRLNRDKSESNRIFDQMKRGDIVEWSGGNRVESYSFIKRIKNF